MGGRARDAKDRLFGSFLTLLAGIMPLQGLLQSPVYIPVVFYYLRIKRMPKVLGPQ